MPDGLIGCRAQGCEVGEGRGDDYVVGDDVGVAVYSAGGTEQTLFFMGNMIWDKLRFRSVKYQI